ncbi:MAG: hypothetical protein LC135_12285 [Phycisphaerae bacterium]|nr:hypothetical protein [Phycisphaerae bacterium]MCZ2400629.1 hypothetical protein [Phycisphaerae bacterium]NUQ49619.1 hypothetical protein [Phycisphaerae bacterium]
MLRGFRHTLFLMLQAAVLFSGGIALVLRPDAWQPIAICVAGAVLASLVCERIASRYLRNTLGRLRRAADDLGRGRATTTVIEAQPGDDLYKLVSAINLVATRLSEAAREQQRLNEELQRRERLAFLGELAATVAHEVNNPLDGVQNCARILRRSLDDPQRSRQMLDLIDGGLERIEIIVRRLLTLARQNVIRAERVHLARVVDNVVALQREKIEARNVRVATRIEARSDLASVDAPLIEQVLINLITNAVDSMPDGGELTLTVRRENAVHAGDTAAGDVLCIDVADNGGGIPPHVLPHIFEPFYTTKQGGRGTGLGLAIAARIADAHQGAIEVADRPGGGTVFTVRLPALPETAAEYGRPQRLAVARGTRL